MRRSPLILHLLDSGGLISIPANGIFTKLDFILNYVIWLEIAKIPSLVISESETEMRYHIRRSSYVRPGKPLSVTKGKYMYAGKIPFLALGKYTSFTGIMCQPYTIKFVIPRSPHNAYINEISGDLRMRKCKREKWGDLRKISTSNQEISGSGDLRFSLTVQVPH